MINRINSGAGLSAYGDSITKGEGASTTAHGYASKMAAAVGGSFANYAVSGEGTYMAAKKSMSVPTRRRNVVTVLAGLNDARRAGLAAKNKIITNLRSLILTNLLASNSPASALSRSGSWNVIPSNSIPTRSVAIGGNALYTSDVNAVMTYAFKGDALIIGTVTTHTSGSSSYRDLEYSIDGGPRETLANYNLTNEPYSHNGIMLRGLGDGAHTLKIYPKSSTPWSVVDYVGTPLAEPLAAGPILVGQIPYVTNWVYSGFTLTPAIVDEINQAISDMVAEFDGFPVALVKTNDFYDTATGCSADGIHPNNIGHAQLFSAFINSLEIST